MNLNLIEMIRILLFVLTDKLFSRTKRICSDRTNQDLFRRISYNVGRLKLFVWTNKELFGRISHLFGRRERDRERGVKEKERKKGHNHEYIDVKSLNQFIANSSEQISKLSEQIRFIFSSGPSTQPYFNAAVITK